MKKLLCHIAFFVCYIVVLVGFNRALDFTKPADYPEGFEYAKAEEPQDREKAKGHLKSAIIGFVLIFVLMLALKLATPILQDWVTNNTLPKE